MISLSAESAVRAGAVSAAQPAASAVLGLRRSSSPVTVVSPTSALPERNAGDDLL